MCEYRQILQYLTVSKHLGWVRNVVLIKCIFGSGKPRGVGISGCGPHGLNKGIKSQFRSNQETKLKDPVTARRVPSKWIKGNKGSKGNKESKGNKGSKGLAVYI